MGKLAQALASKDTIEIFEHGWEVSNGFSNPAVTDALINACGEALVVTLGEIACVTVADIRDAWRHSALEAGLGFHRWYESFKGFLLNAATQRWRSDPLQLDVLGVFQTVQFPDAIRLWQSRDEAFVVHLLGQFPAAQKLYAPASFQEEEAGRLLVTVEAMGSESFFKRFCEKVTQSLSALISCTYSLASLWIQPQSTRDLLNPDFSNRCDDDMARFSDAVRLYEIGRLVVDEEESQSGVEAVPLMSPSLLLIRDCLDALFSEVMGKKDCMQRRVKNAVHLLTEAKRQSDNAIGLALSVSAIEALVCRKGDNVAQMFAENMAVLLEPELAYRSAAERWCKSKYDQRSGVLHGSLIASGASDLRETENAATAVLKAMLERRRAVRRVGGDDENPEELLRELKEAKYNVGHPMFVDESPVNRLWRKPTV